MQIRQLKLSCSAFILSRLVLSVSVMVAMVLSFCFTTITQADVVNLDLGQAQLIDDVVYRDNVIKLKTLEEWGRDFNYLRDGYLFVFKKGSQTVYKSSPISPDWSSVSYSSPLKQVFKYGYLTTDNQLRIQVGNVVYTDTNVKKFVPGNNRNGYYYHFILYQNGSVGVVTHDSSEYRVINPIPGLENDVVDIFWGNIGYGGIFAVKSNGDLWSAPLGSYSIYAAGSSSCISSLQFGYYGFINNLVACKHGHVSNIKEVAGNYPDSYTALTYDGRVICWGNYKNCGTGYTTDYYTSTPATILSNVKYLRGGNGGKYVAVTNDNEIYYWSTAIGSIPTLASVSLNNIFVLQGDDTIDSNIWGLQSSMLFPILTDTGFVDQYGNAFPDGWLVEPLKQGRKGVAVFSVPLSFGKAVASVNVTFQGDVRFLFSTDGNTWYKFENGTFVSKPLNENNANTYSEVIGITESALKSFTANKNQLKIAVFLLNSTPEPQLNAISVNIIDLLTISEVSCDQTSVYPGQLVNCNATIQKDPSLSGTLTTNWQILKSNGSNGGEVVDSSNNGDIYMATIRPIGVDTPKIVKVNACVGSTCISRTQELTVQSLQAPQISLNCPASLYVGQSGDCVATIQLPEGLPSYITPVINWNATTGTQLTPSENTASVLPVTETDKTVTVKVSYNYAPDVFSQQSANIQITPTEITGSLNCPEEAYKGQTITCVLEYQSSREGLSVQWLTPVESVSDDMKTARIKVASNTVSAKVFVQEYPSLYKNFTATLTMRVPPKPIISINSANGTGNSGLVNIPFNIRGAILCPEGLTCSYEWYINDELQQIDSLEFSKTFQQAGVQIITLVAWVDAVEPRELVTSRADYRVLIYDYPRLFMYGIADKKYATVGETITFTAVDSSRESYSDLFPVKVTWLLPDGSTVEGKSATYTVQEEDVDLNNPVKKTIVFSYQYVGVPDSLKSGQVSVVLLPPYRMPDVDIKLYTPAEGPVPHAVVAAPRFSQQFLPGYRYNITYDWELIGTDITGNKKYFYGDITTPGEYTLRLTVGDGLGNVIEKEIPIRATDPLPWNVDFKIYRSNRYNVAPLNLLIKPVLYGGHPRDRVIQYKWTVDGSEISDKTILALRLEDPGTYTVNFTGLTKYGNVVEGETTIEVNPNEPPTCSLSSRTFTGTKTLYVSANCKDPDGIITAYYWSINGGEETKGGSRISLRYDEAGGPITVTLRVVDSGGNNVEVTETFTIP